MSRFQPSSDVVYTEMDDSESVLLHLKTRRYYSLNETGTLIWGAIQEGKSEEEIVQRIVEAYEIEAPEAQQHLDAFISDLEADELVRRA